MNNEVYKTFKRSARQLHINRTLYSSTNVRHTTPQRHRLSSATKRAFYIILYHKMRYDIRKFGIAPRLAWINHKSLPQTT